MVRVSRHCASADGPASTPIPAYVSVKEAVCPSVAFRAWTPCSSEMRSTGEVMGWARVSVSPLPRPNWRRVRDCPTWASVHVLADPTRWRARARAATGGTRFSIAATVGTAGYLRSNDVPCEPCGKDRSRRPGRGRVSMMGAGEVQLVVNTPSGGEPAPTVRPFVRPAWCTRCRVSLR